MILNGAYLVARRGDPFLRGSSSSVRAIPTVELEVAGPWAPYSFATLEAPDDG